MHVCNTAILKDSVMSKPENQDNDEEYIIDWHLEYLEEYLKE